MVPTPNVHFRASFPGIRRWSIKARRFLRCTSRNMNQINQVSGSRAFPDNQNKARLLGILWFHAVSWMPSDYRILTKHIVVGIGNEFGGRGASLWIVKNGEGLACQLLVWLFAGQH